MIKPAPRLSLVTTAGFDDYALLDSGAGRKLERFGEVIVNRPEPQALWRQRLAAAQWAKAHAVFSASGEDEEKGRWRVDRPVPGSWPVRIVPPHTDASGRSYGNCGGPTRFFVACSNAYATSMSLGSLQAPPVKLTP